MELSAGPNIPLAYGVQCDKLCAKICGSDGIGSLRCLRSIGRNGVRVRVGPSAPY